MLLIIFKEYLFFFFVPPSEFWNAIDNLSIAGIMSGTFSQ